MESKVCVSDNLVYIKTLCTFDGLGDDCTSRYISIYTPSYILLRVHTLWADKITFPCLPPSHCECGHQRRRSDKCYLVTPPPLPGHCTDPDGLWCARWGAGNSITADTSHSDHKIVNSVSRDYVPERFPSSSGHFWLFWCVSLSARYVWTKRKWRSESQRWHWSLPPLSPEM